jgi:hypothetical protein
MWRRLYFVLPDEPHAVKLLSDLQALGVTRTDVHAIPGRGAKLQHLLPATPRQAHDFLGRVERILWRANLGVFAVALVGLVAAIQWDSTAGIVTAAMIMAVTFAAGAVFTIRVPDTRLAEFHDALTHDEILLLVDVPRRRVNAVEKLVYRRHPEAVAGGVTWAIRMLGA